MALNNLGYNTLSFLAAPVTGAAKIGSSLGIPGANSLYKALSPTLTTSSQPQPKTTSGASGSWTVTNPIADQQKKITTTNGNGIATTGGGFTALQPTLLGTENVFDPNSINWDQMFAPAFAAYDQRQREAEAAKTASLGQIDTDQQAALDSLNQEEREQRDLLGSAERQTYAGAENAVSQAARLAADARQANTARYGNANSTGQAASDILNQALFRETGGIERQKLSALDQLAGEGRRLTSFVAEQTNNIKRQAEQYKREVSAQFENVLTQIATARGQTEAEKSAQRLNALQSAKAALLQIDQYNNQLLNQLAQFNANARNQLAAAASQAAGVTDKTFLDLLDRGFGAQMAGQLAGFTEQQVAGLPTSSIGKGFEKVSGLGQDFLVNPLTREVMDPNTFQVGTQVSQVPYTQGVRGFLNTVIPFGDPFKYASVS